MDSIRSIIAVGGYEGNQSKFITQIKPTKLKEDAEIALTSIFHGQVLNISGDNNKIHFLNIDNLEIEGQILTEDAGITPDSHNFKTLTIPKGFYHSSYAVCLAIEEQVVNVLNLPKRNNPLTVSLDKRSNTIQMQLNNLIIKNEKDSPWELLGFSDDLSDTHELKNISFDGQQLPVFVYINVIENSYINGRSSRISTVIPVKTYEGWSYFEPSTPDYCPINVKEFSNILVELRDLNGKFIDFDPAFKTIITLSVRSSLLYKDS